MSLPPPIPSTLPPILRDQRKVDADHLQLLSLFHFVAAGLSAMGLLLLFGHFMMFQTVFTNEKIWEGAKDKPPLEIFAIFKWFYLVFGLWIGSSVVLNVLSGLKLRVREWRTFSLITAALNCLHMPIGTVLGVFTFIVLLRDSVRELYEAEAASRPLP